VSEPSLDGVSVDNQLNPNSNKVNCEDWDEFFQVRPNGDSVVLQGSYPLDCGEREQNLSVVSHTRYVSAVFKAIWKSLGGSLLGKQREGEVGASAKLLSTHRSEPLGNLIRDINKFSNNVMARQLFLTLGETSPALGLAQTANITDSNSLFKTYPLNIERSVFATQTWLARNRLDFKELVLENGAGLSRKERISARHMVQLLQHAYAHPLSAELQASLPILGVDGSVKRRLRESPAAGHAHLKTGTLEGVKTIAGYVRSKSGKQWTVVFFINHPYAKQGQAAQDALIEWVQQR
ncbi:MAG: D-alanyl-D-alanine carboxypeptidase/D-alanyl-D-alanine-endopeptidase, partial [Pseudomonadota bacterium]